MQIQSTRTIKPHRTIPKLESVAQTEQPVGGSEDLLARIESRLRASVEADQVRTKAGLFLDTTIEGTLAGFVGYASGGSVSQGAVLLGQFGAIHSAIQFGEFGYNFGAQIGQEQGDVTKGKVIGTTLGVLGGAATGGLHGAVRGAGIIIAGNALGGHPLAYAAVGAVMGLAGMKS